MQTWLEGRGLWNGRKAAKTGQLRFFNQFTNSTQSSGHS